MKLTIDNSIKYRKRYCRNKIKWNTFTKLDKINRCFWQQCSRRASNSWIYSVHYRVISVHSSRYSRIKLHVSKGDILPYIYTCIDVFVEDEFKIRNKLRFYRINTLQSIRCLHKKWDQLCWCYIKNRIHNSNSACLVNQILVNKYILLCLFKAILPHMFTIRTNRFSQITWSIKLPW